MTFSLILALPLIACVIFFYPYLNHRTGKRKKKEEEEIYSNWAQPKDNQFFNFSLIGRYFENKIKYDSSYFQVISEKEREDLLLNDVFKYIDRTISKIGQQFLYFKIRCINQDTEKLQHFDRLVETFQKNKQQSIQCQVELKVLEKDNSYYFEELLHSEPKSIPKWFPLVYILTFAFPALVILAFAFDFQVLVPFLFPVYILNILIHYWNKKNINYYFIALSEFDKAYELASKLATLETVKGHFQQVEFLKVLAPLKKKMKWVRLSTKFEDDLTMAFYAIIELLKITVNFEILVFFTVIIEIETKGRPLNELFEFIGEIDAAISTASLRAGLPEYCKPVFSSPKQLKVVNLQHPLILNCIPNDLQLHNRSLLLTGSNMSGKTTFIRSIGINILLAQTIYTCTASYFEAPFSKIYTSIKIEDDLLSEKSYYLEEVITLQAFIEKSQGSDPIIFILDEIFKGTNTVERISGGKAILSYLTKGNHFVFVSTHDIELTELLKSQFDLYHFSESILGSNLVFDHELKRGPLTRRNAIKILEMNQYPAEIIEEANNLVKKLETSIVNKAKEETYA